MFVCWFIRNEVNGFGFKQKREKRRWLFRKATSSISIQQCEANAATNTALVVNSSLEAEQRHAIAVAAATAAAAEAAVATAQAAVEIIRLSTRPPSCISAREHYAAIVIQTAFRGYLVSDKQVTGKMKTCISILNCITRISKLIENIQRILS